MALHRLLRGAERDDPFYYSGHPGRAGQNATLAWARIDFDLGSGDALIEEIQSDRIRDVLGAMGEKPCSSCGRIHYCGYRLSLIHI